LKQDSDSPDQEDGKKLYRYDEDDLYEDEEIMYRIDGNEYQGHEQFEEYSPDKSQKQFVKVVANIVSIVRESNVAA